MVFSMVSTHVKYFYPSFKGPPLVRNIMVPPSAFSGTEVYIPWFTDIIYQTIQNFRFLKHMSLTLWCDDITLYYTWKHSQTYYIT